MMTKVRTFVYGTLKRGNSLNEGWMKGAEFVGEARTNEPAFALYSLGWYPCLTTGTNYVDGEVWDMDDKNYAHLEDMEHGAGYVTRQVDVLCNGETMTVNAFMFDCHPPMDKLKAGPDNVVCW